MRKAALDQYQDWILEHKDDYHTLMDLIAALKDNFGIDVKRNTIKSWFRRRFGITTIYGTHEFSNEEMEFIKKYYPDNGPEKTAHMINELFHTNRTYNSVSLTANKNGIKVSQKYLSDLAREKSKKMVDVIRRDQGSVRMEIGASGKPVYRMKVADGVWRTAGIVIWEQANGPIPKGYKLIYLDGDSSNYQLDNLYLASHKLQYQVIRNRHYKSGNPEITKSLIKYYELRNVLGIDWREWQRIEKKFERLGDNVYSHNLDI